jgi:hypothetical protein
MIAETHGKNVLHLVLVVGYLRKILDNAPVVQFMLQTHPEVHGEFQKLIESRSLGQEVLCARASVGPLRQLVDHSPPADLSVRHFGIIADQRHVIRHKCRADAKRPLRNRQPSQRALAKRVHPLCGSR